MKSLSPDTRAQPNRCGALFVSGERVRTAHPCQPLDALPFHRPPESQPQQPATLPSQIVRPGLPELRMATSPSPSSKTAGCCGPNRSTDMTKLNNKPKKAAKAAPKKAPAKKAKAR